jgi:mono/diheme cytochrome c family protein
MSRQQVRNIVVLMVCGWWLVGCNGGKNQTNIELIQDMMEQRSLKSQKFDNLTNTPEARTPPDGTVPRGYTPYEFHNDAIAAEAKLVNPFGGDKVAATLARGKDRFDIYCTPCHGYQGKGDGKVAPYMALKPPSLVADHAKSYKDGRIYHVITDGQGLMNAYSTQITKSDDRWAIVNYVRSLQKAN